MAQPVYQPPREENAMQNLGNALGIINTFFGIRNSMNQGDLQNQQKEANNFELANAAKLSKGIPTGDMKARQAIERQNNQASFELQRKGTEQNQQMQGFNNLMNQADEVNKAFAPAEQTFARVNALKKIPLSELNGNDRFATLKNLVQAGEVVKSTVREGEVAAIDQQRPFLDKIAGTLSYYGSNTAQISDKLLNEMFSAIDKMRPPVAEQYKNNLKTIADRSKVFGLGDRLPEILGSQYDVYSNKREFGKFNLEGYSELQPKGPLAKSGQSYSQEEHPAANIFNAEWARRQKK